MEEKVDLQWLIRSRMKFCRHCDVAVLTAGVRKKKSDIPYLCKEEFEVNKDDEMMFCCEDCYEQFATAHRHARESQVAREEASAQAEAQRLKLVFSSVQQQASPAKEQPPTPHSQDKLRLRAGSAEVGRAYPPIMERKWKGLRYKRWEPSLKRIGQVAPPPTDAELSQVSPSLHPFYWSELLSMLTFG